MKKLVLKKIKGLLLLLTLFTSINLSKASHMMGADMTYTYLGNGKYKIIVKAYRDCRGVSMSVVAFKAYAGTNGGNGCGTVTPATLTRIGIRDVSTICSSATAPCNPSNTYGTGKGIEEHTFEAVVDFNTSPLNSFVNKSSCCEVSFYINECCRNGGITTGPAGNDFYTTCMINICNLKKTKIKSNSSPKFSNVPVGYLCCNVPWYFNNGALDTIDFDSISYKLVRGLNGVPNNSVSYSSPFAYNYPMTPLCVPNTTIKCATNKFSNPPVGFYFDTANGDIITTPTKCDESPVIVIESTEWRQDSLTGTWIVVGKTRRDMQLWILDDCGYNKAPMINGTFDTAVCEGHKICQVIKITDETSTPNQTVPDTVLATWNRGIPGATFSVINNKTREKEYIFCWQTKIGDARPNHYMFTVTATDQHCTPPVTSTRAFRIKVIQSLTTTISIKRVNCSLYQFSQKSNMYVDSVWWFIKDFATNKTIYQSAKTTDVVSLNTGKYLVQMYAKNQRCGSYSFDKDTLIVADFTKTDTSSINACTMYYLKATNRNYYYNTVVIDTIRTTDGICDSIIHQYNIRITRLNDSVYYKFPYLYARDNSADHYDWLDCNNSFKSVNPTAYDSIRYWPKNGGSFALRVTKNGCSDTSQCIQISNNKVVNDILFASSVYPNPVKSELDLTANQNIQKVEIMDAAGKLVLQQQINQKTAKINVQMLEQGIYFIKVYNLNQELITHQIIKD